MPNTQFHTAISRPRYMRYLSACGNKRKALKLYRANIALSQKMFSIIAIFEVILRNTMDRYMIAKKGPSWLEEAAAPGGYLHKTKGCENSVHAVQKVIFKSGSKYSHDRLISELTLGFWRHHFAPKHYSAAGNSLLEIFVNRPVGIKQKDILLRLTKINELRNRIAHHEPICFRENQISTEKIERIYKTILELLEWLGCNPNKILYGINQARSFIIAIKNL